MAEYMDPAMDAMEDAAGAAAENAYTAAMQNGARSLCCSFSCHRCCI